MRRRQTAKRNRHLRCESLEARQLLAAYINEIHYSPLFGDNTTDQYLEFRGPANSLVEAGTYFVGIESADGVDELGDIHTVFDLSGKSFGANGLMVFIQGGSGFDLNTGANIFKGTNGFLGIPGFSSDDVSPSIHDGSSTFLLVRSDASPSLSSDIDLNDDGFADGEYLTWTVLDGVSVFDWVESPFSQHAYAPILFTEDDVGSSLPGTTRVVTDGLAYVGRIGNSTGSQASDWVAANTVETDRENPSRDFQLQRGVFGTAVPNAYSARILDHIGGSNWFSDFSGTVFQDINSDGVRQSEEPGLSDVAVELSRSGANQGAGTYTEEIVADDYNDGDDVSITSSNVTLSSAGSSNEHQSFEITVKDKTFTKPELGQQFAHAGVDFFNENRRLRMDFFKPVHSVSANFRGNSSLSDVYGRLEVFDAKDQSLGFLRTAALRASDQQLLTLSRPAEEIAYAVAYSNDEYLDSSPFGRIDFLSFSMSDVGTVTDADGNYSISRVTSGDYDLFAEPLVGYEFSAPTGGSYAIDIQDPSIRSDLDFALVGGVPPSLSGRSFVASEAADVGSSVGKLGVRLGYPHQQLTAEILTGNAAGNFAVDLAGDRLVLAGPLDFEAVSRFELLVRITDDVDNSLFSEATVTVTVADANDAPVVEPFDASVAENSPAGDAVGVMSATDQDSTFGSDYLLSIEAGNRGGAFALDAETGKLSVATTEPVDFEANAAFVLTVRATDTSDSTVYGERDVTVTVTDINEAPVIPPQRIAVSEAIQPGFSAGFISYTEPDLGQALSWQILQQPEGDNFTIHSAGEIRISESGSLDFEAVAEFLLVVKATDNGLPAMSAEQTVTISVSDANDPPRLTSDTLEFSEAALAGQVIGQILAVDDDAGQTLTYAFVSGADDLFSVDATTGEITLVDAEVVDYEALEHYEIVVDVTDSAATPAGIRETLTLLVTDANDAPVISSQGLTAAENAATGSSVGTILVEDQDANDTHTFTIQSQSADWFRIDTASGELFVADGANVDFETSAEVQLALSVADAAGATNSKTIAITIENRNDAPKLVAPLTDVGTPINESFSLTIPESTFVDDDADDMLRWIAVTETGFPLPAWLNFDAETRTFSGVPTHNDIGGLAVKIQVVDNSQAFASDVFEIDVLPELFPWHNSALATDTNGDSFVAPSDALRVINYLNGGRDAAIAPGSSPEFGRLDVNRDNFVSAIDVLIIVNHLNRANGGGEGEQTPEYAAAVEAYFSGFDAKDRLNRWRDEWVELGHDDRSSDF